MYKEVLIIEMLTTLNKCQISPKKKKHPSPQPEDGTPYPAKLRPISSGCFHVCRYNPNSDVYRSSYGAAKDPPSSSRSSKYSNRNRNDEPEPKSRFTSRFLNKTKSAGTVLADEDDLHPATGRRYSGNDDLFYGASRREPAYSSYKDRKARLARSKSTHGFGEDVDADLDEAPPASSYYPSSYLASKASNSGNDLSRSRSSHVLKSRENSPERQISNAGIVQAI